MRKKLWWTHHRCDTGVAEASEISLGAVQPLFLQSSSFWVEGYGQYKILCCPVSVMKTQECKCCLLKLRFLGRNAAAENVVALPASFTKSLSFRKFPLKGICFLVEETYANIFYYLKYCHSVWTLSSLLPFLFIIFWDCIAFFHEIYFDWFH